MAKSFSILVSNRFLQHLLSRMVGGVANCRWRWFKNWAIRRFIRKYHIDIAAAQSDRLEDYPSFNSFFIRQLKPTARPIVQGPNDIASPVDGAISQIGRIQDEAIFQAKGFHFTLTTLLGNKSEQAALFRNGYFTTVYLAPRDYHRVHMPITGKLKSTTYIPGQLFSVNTYTTEHLPALFARNERLVCLFETAAGPMAVILVGAMLVGSIHTVWQSPCATDTITEQHYPEGITLARGAELGHFKMGSTVILLFGKQSIEWATTLHQASTLQMGQLIGNTL